MAARARARARLAVLAAIAVACVTAPAAVARPLGAGSAATPAFEPVPTVASVSPTEGSTLGGDKVTIKGSGFVEPVSVTIGSPATSVVVVSPEEITATTTAHGAGPQEVVVKAAGGTSTGGPTFTYVVPPKPKVASITPETGSTLGGTKVKIKGTGFVEGATVTIGSTATSVEVVSPEEITATTAPHEVGAPEVVVTDAGGSSTGGPTFTYAVPEPTVESITPNKGSTLGGDKVKIKGTGFFGPATVTIGSAATSVVVVSSEEITATTSAHEAGSQEVVVKTPGGTSALGPSFTYVVPPPPPPPPEVKGVAPAEGPESGGTTVTITGANLSGVTAVRFGATASGSVVVNSPTSITATAPPGRGKVDVTVTTAGGTSATSAADAFTYVAPVPPPPPPAAATCTMKPIFLTIERKRKRKTRPKVVAGQLRITVTCTDNASVRLGGHLTMPVGKKPKHGKQHMRAFVLGPSTASLAKNVGTVIALKLPLGTVVALVAKAKEAVRVTLNATSAGGASHNSVTIKQLRI